MVEAAPLLGLLNALKSRQYRFITPTPATHARVVARPLKAAPTLRDIFGWNRSFTAADLEPDLFAMLEAAAALAKGADGFKSRVRVSSLGDDLFLHSAFPTDDDDAVFFGPDTYRFARFVAARMRDMPLPQWIVDMGAGSGAGGIAAARLAPDASVTLADVNRSALVLAAINAQAAGVEVETVESGSLPPGADLVIANPPYLMDRGERTYRDGGELLGGGVALDWAGQALRSLAPGGTMLLYTGAAFVDGRSPLIQALTRACVGSKLEIEELDPDVFGEELENDAYSSVERIAVIGAILNRA